MVEELYSASKPEQRENETRDGRWKTEVTCVLFGKVLEHFVLVSANDVGRVDSIQKRNHLRDSN